MMALKALVFSTAFYEFVFSHKQKNDKHYFSISFGSETNQSFLREYMKNLKARKHNYCS